MIHQNTQDQSNERYFGHYINLYSIFPIGSYGADLETKDQVSDH